MVLRYRWGEAGREIIVDSDRLKQPPRVLAWDQTDARLAVEIGGPGQPGEVAGEKIVVMEKAASGPWKETLRVTGKKPVWLGDHLFILMVNKG